MQIKSHWLGILEFTCLSLQFCPVLRQCIIQISVYCVCVGLTEVIQSTQQCLQYSLWTNGNTCRCSVTTDRVLRVDPQQLTRHRHSCWHNMSMLSKCHFRLYLQYSVLYPQFERVLCVPVSLAPVERVFSQSGLVMRRNRTRMIDKLLEELVFAKCNDL